MRKLKEMGAGSQELPTAPDIETAVWLPKEIQPE